MKKLLLFICFLAVGNALFAQVPSQVLEITFQVGISVTTSQDVAALPKQERNRVLKGLCDYGASVRQIARVTGVAYGVVYRISRHV